MSGSKLMRFIVSALMAFDVPLDKYKSRGTPCRDPKLIKRDQSEKIRASVLLTGE